MMAWTVNLFGYLFLFFFFFCGKGCNSTNLSRPSGVSMANSKGKTENSTNTECNVPYHPVGDYCLLIKKDIIGTWSEMQDICKGLGGNLVNLQDANILYEISQYIKSNGMDDVSYWVGATDEAEEGKWVWSSDNSEVKGGTPLWGDLPQDQPDGREDENCAALDVNDFHYMQDDLCNGVTYGVICQPTASEKVLVPNDDLEKANVLKRSNNDCPYEMIGNACLMVYPARVFNWTEAKEYCESLNTHMAKIDDANFLGDVYDYLTEQEIKAYLWIGGTDEASEGEWVWHDATPMKLGTPYWDVTAIGSQAPSGGIAENCAFFWWGDSYFFNDSYCFVKRGVICQYDM